MCTVCIQLKDKNLCQDASAGLIPPKDHVSLVRYLSKFDISRQFEGAFVEFFLIGSMTAAS